MNALTFLDNLRQALPVSIDKRGEVSNSEFKRRMNAKGCALIVSTEVFEALKNEGIPDWKKVNESDNQS